MKKASITVCLLITTLFAKTQSAELTITSFMIGNYNYSKWERLDFDVSRSSYGIKYSYASKPNGILLKPAGIKLVNGRKALSVKLPGYNSLLFIYPDRRNNRVQMFSSDGKYNKYFPLWYEGPVNGRGTFCERCANEPDEAFKIIGYFFR